MIAKLSAVPGLAAVGILVLSCTSGSGGNTANGSGSADLSVSTEALSSADIDHITVTISGPHIEPSIVVTLQRNPVAGWHKTVGNIPAGDNRTFLAEAFDASNHPLYQGSATNVTIVDGQSVIVTIYLQQIAPPTPFLNAVPRFTSLIVSDNKVAPERTVSLIANAVDPDPQDTLTYHWAGGTFSSDSSASTVWTAPSDSGSYRLTVTATDPKGAAASLGVDIDVQVFHGRGRAGISVTINTSPEVAGLVPSPTRIDVGETTQLALTASDADGDALSFTWSSSCTGTFSSPAAEDPSFTLTSSNGGADCTLSVAITDGRGGTNNASVTLQTGPGASASAGFTATADMIVSRGPNYSFGLTFLDDGRALATGGSGADILSSAEIYDPSLGTWSPVAAMSAARYGHSATLLADGRVLVAGGFSGSSQVATAEIYDPVSNTWTPTGSMSTVRSGHYSALLGNGKVLVAGGGIHNPSDTIATASAELFDPERGTWSSTGSLNAARMNHSGALLGDGRVLVAGGTPQGVTTTNYTTAELYDPGTGTWTYTANSMAVGRRGGFGLVRLQDGKVLVAGGCVDWTARATNLAELFDPATNTWTPTSSMPATRQFYSASLLADGKVLFAGGDEHPGDFGSGTLLNTALLFDPLGGTWTSTASNLTVARQLHHAARLLDGRVLLVGGYAPSGANLTPTKTCEIYRESL